MNLPSTLSFPAATIGRTPAALIWLMAALTAADLPPPRLMFMTALPASLAFWAAEATVIRQHVISLKATVKMKDIPNCIPATTSLESELVLLAKAVSLHF